MDRMAICKEGRGAPPALNLLASGLWTSQLPELGDINVHCLSLPSLLYSVMAARAD